MRVKAHGKDSTGGLGMLWRELISSAIIAVRQSALVYVQNVVCFLFNCSSCGGAAIFSEKICGLWDSILLHNMLGVIQRDCAP